MFAYCSNSPVCSSDPLGTYRFLEDWDPSEVRQSQKKDIVDGVVGRGVEGSAAFGVRGSLGGQIVYDGTNIGLLFYGSLGGGTPTSSFSQTYTLSNAESIHDLAGVGFACGGSATLPIFGVAGKSAGLEFMCGEGYQGLTLSSGVGCSLPEAHGELTYTIVIDITEYIEFLGKEEEIKQFIYWGK